MNLITRLKNKYKSNNIIRHSAELFFTQSFASVVALINTSIMAKGLGIKGVGIIGVVVAYSAFFDGLLNFQSYYAVIKFGSDAIAEKNESKLLNYYCIGFYQDLGTSVLAFLLGYSLVNIASGFFGWDERVILLIKVYLISIPINISGSTNGILRLNDKFAVTGIVNTVANLLKTLLLLISLRRGLSLELYVLIELIRIMAYNFSVIGVSMIICKRKHNETPLNIRRIRFDKEFTKYNIYNNLVSTIDMPTGQMVNFIINKYLGFEAVGVYSILTKLGGIVGKVTSPISQSMLPELSRLVSIGNESSAWKISKKIFRYINAAGIGFAFFLSIAYKLWMPFFMDATIRNCMYFFVYLVYLTFTFASVGIHAYFIANNYVKYNLYICTGCNFVYLVLLFITIKRFELFSVIGCLFFQAVMVVAIKILIVKRKKALGGN